MSFVIGRARTLRLRSVFLLWMTCFGFGAAFASAEGAVGLLENSAVRLEKRTDIWIEARGTSSIGRSVKVRVQLSDLELTGHMSAEHFERSEHWKLGTSQPRSIAA